MRKRYLIPALAAALVSGASADTVSLDLTGTYTSVDIWGAGSLSGSANTGFPSFPGTAAWPRPIASASGADNDAFLTKVDNQKDAAIGTGLGGPFPSGGGIYFGGFGTVPNTNGGTLQVTDAAPILNLGTVTFQIEIGQAYGYDLLNNDLSLVKLNYTTATGSGSLSATYTDLLNRFYNGSVDMPTGAGGAMQPEDIYVNLWGLQWDLSSIEGITSFNIQFTGVEHSSLAQLQLDQTSTAYDSTVLSQDVTWVGGGSDSHWSTTGNWAEGALPAEGKNVVVSAGTGVTVDSEVSVGTLTINAATGQLITTAGDAVLNLTSGITSSSAGEVTHEIAGAVDMAAYNLIDLEAGNTLVLSAALTGAGFYKQGEGTLVLSGNNVYDSGNASLAANGIMIRGGVNYISGTNTLAGANTVDFKVRQDTTVILQGDNRLDSKFVLNLLAPSSKVVLGDENGKSDLAVSGLAGSVGVDLVTGSKIVGGSENVSTLTVNVDSGTREFGGDIGGAGANENNIALVKTGSGTQTLKGVNTYSGATRIEGGLLRADSATALSANSNIQIAGGVLGFGGSNYAANLGTGAGEVQFLGGGGFSASGAARTVTLNGGAGLAWGEGGFVGAGARLILSHATADNMVDFVNSIDLGDAVRTVQVDNGTGAIDARLSGVLSGEGSLIKAGAGTLELTAANTYTGTTDIREGGLSLSGASGSLAGDVNVAAGATLQLTNTAAANNADRIADTAKVSLRGGILNFNNPTTGTTPSFSETLGELALDSGASVVTTSRAADGNTATLSLGTLTRQAGATVNFNGASVGADSRNRVLFSAAPSLTNGLLGAWATVGTIYEFATYGANGVTAYTGYNTNLAQGSWAAANNVKLNTAAGMTTTLTAARTINSLNMTGATSGAVGNQLNLGGQTLRIGTGGFIATGGAATRQNVISNGSLTAGESEGQSAEFIATIAGSQTYVNASVVDNGAGAVSFVKAGSGTLYLGGANTYSGGTTVNQGTLIINGGNTGGGAATVRRASTLTVNGSLAVTGRLQVDGTLNGTGALNFGSNVTVSGSGSINHSITVGGGAGQVAVLSPGNSPGTLTFGANQTWADGGALVWEIKDTELGAGIGWDTINITGTLTIAITEEPFVINIASLTAADEAGLLAGFDPGSSYSWVLATATGGITGFNAGLFSLDTSDFANGFDGSFSLTESGNSLVLNYSAVPEPGTWALLGIAGLCVVIFRRRLLAGR